MSNKTPGKKGIFNWLIHWWPTVLAFGLVLWLTLAPNPVPDEDIPIFPGADKIVHAIMMGGLTGIILFDYNRAKTRPSEDIPFDVICITGIAMLVFCILDEIAQTSMGLGRSGDFWDFVADSVGILLACVLAKPIIRYLHSLLTK